MVLLRHIIRVDVIQVMIGTILVVKRATLIIPLRQRVDVVIVQPVIVQQAAALLMATIVLPVVLAPISAAFLEVTAVATLQIVVQDMQPQKIHVSQHLLVEK